MIKVHKPLVAESLGFVFWLGANPLSKISLNYLRAAAPAADPGKECEEAGEGQRLRTK